MNVRGLVDADREVALLLDIVAATGSGPAVEPLADAVARMITAATASDVCFVHVLDDSEQLPDPDRCDAAVRSEPSARSDCRWARVSPAGWPSIANPSSSPATRT